MRAAVVRTPGATDAIELVDTPTPQPGPGEIRIRVKAAAVNPVDLQTVQGIYHQLGWVTQTEQTGLGWDVAGEVSAVGEGVTEFTVGTSVAALSEGVDKAVGPYAEEVVVPAKAASAVPAGLEATDAATVPLNGLTATQALDLLGPAEGRTVLVTGAAGGVGGYGVRLAAARGWTVLGLARETDRADVTEGGAELVTTLEGLEPVDAVFDTAVLADAAVAAVRDGGHYVGVMPPAVPASVRGVETGAVMVTANGEQLADLLARTAAGELPARVHAVVPLDEVQQVHAKVAGGGVRGRYVLTP